LQWFPGTNNKLLHEDTSQNPRNPHGGHEKAPRICGGQLHLASSAGKLSINAELMTLIFIVSRILLSL